MVTTLIPNERADKPRRGMHAGARHQVDLPAVSRFLSRGFNWYVPRYLRRHFNAVRVVKQSAPEMPAHEMPADEAVVCYANHPAWWDPLMAFLLNPLYFPGTTVYAPIDREALDQYPVFRKLGFYGIDLGSLEGAKRFLCVTRALLERSTTTVWMTPGGRFADVRAPTTFQPGLAHLAATVPNVAFVPVAFEYTFWEERTPEALVEFGRVIRTTAGKSSKDEWQHELQGRLAAAQASLAHNSMSRDPANFDIVLDGAAGVGGWYDLFRRVKSLTAGRSFQPRHRRMRTTNRSTEDWPMRKQGRGELDHGDPDRQEPSQ